MKAADGKMRLADVANTEQLFRLIQSISSPKAELFLIYLVMHLGNIVLFELPLVLTNGLRSYSCKALAKTLLLGFLAKAA
ncbi:hypothetical protein [Flavobacterium sp. FlaQc-50]|uniref:hypothetical protein n=1 Tax=unclassified Flavobacterium TaxID=196869 RepID=UPI0037584B44